MFDPKNLSEAQRLLKELAFQRKNILLIGNGDFKVKNKHDDFMGLPPSFYLPDSPFTVLLLSELKKLEANTVKKLTELGVDPAEVEAEK